MLAVGLVGGGSSNEETYEPPEKNKNEDGELTEEDDTDREPVDVKARVPCSYCKAVVVRDDDGTCSRCGAPLPR